MRHETRDQIMAEIRERLGGHGCVAAVSDALDVSRVSVGGWFNSEIPAHRVPWFTKMTGIPEYRIRPDCFVPPIQ